MVTSPAGIAPAVGISGPGRAEVATPHRHAAEPEADDRGLLDTVLLGAVHEADNALGGDTLLAEPTDECGAGLCAHRLTVSVDGQRLLTDVTFAAERGTVTAVIGPSGAGKSTLIKALGGMIVPSCGVALFDGHHIHAKSAAMRRRIGVVPQDDVVHGLLTVEEALRYAAELRLPHADADERNRAITRVVEELDLTGQRTNRVDTLSGGERKRASVAMELLTGPALLILDEPTSGLDPALDRHVMTKLRQLADAGRVVIVVTHSLTYLHMCHQVVLLAPGGRSAYVGPPAGIGSAMGTTDWADIFAHIAHDPVQAHHAHLSRAGVCHVPSRPSRPVTNADCRRTHQMWNQVSTIVRRQARLIYADRAYFTFLTVLPFVLGALTLIVPGHAGLNAADPRGSAPNEAAQILILLNIAAVFMGCAITIRDLVGERAIFTRERAIGLSPTAYLAAKATVYTGFAIVQAAVLTAIATLGKGGPTRGAALLGSGTGELYVTLAATAAVSATLGLVLSSLARTSEQILPMLVVTIMISIVFSGGLIPITGRPVLEPISWLLPARWGFAASASTVDLRAISPFAPDNESLWTHSSRWWLLDMSILCLTGATLLMVARWRLRWRPCLRTELH
jgi:ABC transport system ATP-binding/permease protein